MVFSPLDPHLTSPKTVESVQIDVSEGPLLGEGAFAEVKLGKWLGIDVACKYFTRGNHFTEFDAFRREIEVHAFVLCPPRLVVPLLYLSSVDSSLRHPNVLIVLGVSASPQRLIVTEYMALGTLRDVIRDAPFLLTEQKSHKVIYEIALGMGSYFLSFSSLCSFHRWCLCLGMFYLHSRTILHRDLRAGNVLVLSSVSTSTELK